MAVGDWRLEFGALRLVADGWCLVVGGWCLLVGGWWTYKEYISPQTGIAVVILIILLGKEG